MGEMAFATPIRYAVVSNQTDTVIPAAGLQSKFFAGVIITSGAAATIVVIRDGTTGGAPVVGTFKVETAATTRIFPMPGLVVLQTGIYADVDANTLELVVLYG